MSCGVGGDPAGWEYLWYKDTQEAALPNTDSSRTDGSSYTISSAALSHSGEYWCRAARGRGPFHSNYSECLKLNISDCPQAVVTIETGWTEILSSDSVTLRCEVQGSSSVWNYTWSRDGEEILQNHTGERLTLMFWSHIHLGEYKCRASRMDRPSYSIVSEGFTTIKITQSEKKSADNELFSMVNTDDIHAEGRFSTGALYEEIDATTETQDQRSSEVVYEEVVPTTETRGFQPGFGQQSVYSVIRFKPLKPLNQDSEVSTGAVYEEIDHTHETQRSQNIVAQNSLYAAVGPKSKKQGPKSKQSVFALSSPM
ncbi:hypothetical protein JZ751_003695 [Albula glossodonta]|uniref:Ig-like domain-containing protein n=1 Tax=Albula glossodonta TaxID=121402 RepID=A0A8T2NDK2_9TELE|nr:hypothetical protein JZ751_003695 [Albula glossodonta]